MLHALAYLSPEEAADGGLGEARFRALEAGLDDHFPGWREAAVVRRPLRNVQVASARQTVAQQGLARIPARPASTPNLYFAGDARDLPYNLAENSLASALEVADLLLSERAAAPLQAAPLLAD